MSSTHSSLRSCLKQPGSENKKKHLQITFGEIIQLYAGDGELYHIDLPETNDDVIKLKIKDESEYHPNNQKPTENNDAASMLGFLSLDTEIAPLNLEITQEPQKEKKKKKDKEKSSKKSKKNKDLLSSPDTASDRKKKFISESISKLVKGETLPKKVIQKIEDSFTSQDSRESYVDFLSSTANEKRSANLQIDSFHQFTKICSTFLSLAEQAQDFVSIWKFVRIMECFSSIDDTERDFLFNSTQGLTIWYNMEFWDATIDLSIVKQTKNPEDAIFSNLAKISYNMQRTGVPSTEITNFLNKHSSALSEKLQNDLHLLITQMQHITEQHVLSQAPVSSTSGIPGEISQKSPQSKKNVPEISIPPQTLSPSPTPISLSSPRQSNVFEVKETLNGHKKKGGVSCMFLHYPKLVSGTITGHTMLYDLETHSYSSLNLQSHKKRISGLFMDDERLITASHDNRIIVWCPITGEITRDFTGHTGNVNAIRVQGDKILSCSDDKTMRISCISDGSSVEIPGHDDFVTDTVWIDENTFASCSKDQTVRIWSYDLGTWKQTVSLTGHTDKITGIAIDTSRNLLITSSNDKTLRTWNYIDGTSCNEFAGHTGAITCFDISNGIVATGSSDRSVRVWNIETAEQQCLFQDKNLDIIASIKISNIDGLVIVGSYDGAIRIWNYETQKMLKVLKGHKDWVYTLSIYDFPDEESESGYVPMIISGSYDTTVKIWEPKRKKRLRKMFSSKNKK